MRRDHWKSTPYVHFICLNLQKGVNTSFGQNHLQYRVITSIGTFSINLWIILLSCRYLQPIRIWKLLHEGYSITHFLFRKKRYWRMSNNQTSSISQKNRTSLKREFDRPGEQNIWIQTPWWFSSSVSTQRGFHAWWCVLACNGQHTKYFPNMFLTKWRGVKMMRSL